MTGNLAILMLSVLRRAGSLYEEADAAKPVLDIRA
jgi:hypothetical protein